MLSTVDTASEALYYSGGLHIGLQYSCTLSFGNTVLFLGGSDHSGYTFNQQISQVTPYGLFRIGTLPFELTRGVCLATAGKIYLGFGVDHSLTGQRYWQLKGCWSRYDNIFHRVLRCSSWQGNMLFSI